MKFIVEKIKIKIEKDHDLLFLDKMRNELDRYQLEIVEEKDSKLTLSKNKLVFNDNDILISFDWEKKLEYHLSQNYSLKKELLSKSLGIGAKGRELIIDASCGAGEDTMLLLAFGAHVRCFERNPIVFSMCMASLLNLKENLKFIKIAKKVDLYFGEARNYPDLLKEAKSIYFDPMYPIESKKRYSKSKKNIEAFKKIVGNDLDSDFMIKELLKFKKWLVLKRPLKAKVLEEYHQSFKGKTVRYDRMMPSL